MGALKDELEELLGPEGLRALSESRGGRRAYIPRRIPAGHWIERALGPERAAALAFRYGGSRLPVPSNPGADPARLKRRIRALREDGWSVSRIASRAGVSERWVYRILGGR